MIRASTPVLDCAPWVTFFTSADAYTNVPAPGPWSAAECVWDYWYGENEEGREFLRELVHGNPELREVGV